MPCASTLPVADNDWPADPIAAASLFLDDAVQVLPQLRAAYDDDPVTCRVLKLARQPYHRWLDKPVADAVLAEAYRAYTRFDAQREDPEFGHRVLADEARDAGSRMADRTAWRICRENRWWSVFGKKRGRGRKAGPPVRDDLVSRNFTASGQNRLWLADITEHATGDGKLYLCAIKDVSSNRTDEVPAGGDRPGQRRGPARTRRRMHPAQRSRIAMPVPEMRPGA